MLAPFDQLFPHLNIYRNNILSATPQKEAASLMLALEFGKNRFPHLVKERTCFIKEFLIAPILCHSLLEFPEIALWSHSIRLSHNNQVLTPHYLLSSAGSPPNYDTLTPPIFLLIQIAEQSDLQAWQETIQIMILLQEINQQKNLPIFAFLTNGRDWELAKLEGQNLYFHSSLFSITSLGLLLGCLHNLFHLFKKYVEVPINKKENENPFIFNLPES
jgi:hypothetical protein